MKNIITFFISTLIVFGIIKLVAFYVLPIILAIVSLGEIGAIIGDLLLINSPLNLVVMYLLTLSVCIMATIIDL